MDRTKYIAAELYSYSYQNYDDHLDMDHERYEKLMPDDAVALERGRALERRASVSADTG